MKQEVYPMRPIGFIHAPYESAADIPRPPSADVRATLTLLPEYVEGAANLQKGDKILVLFYFHAAQDGPLTVRSWFHQRQMGVFSTRSPGRPNPIGVSVVKVEAISGGAITFTGVDMMDGTPVLDIKPNY